MSDKLTAQIERALAVLRGQTKPVRHVVVQRPPRPRGGKPRAKRETYNQGAPIGWDIFPGARARGGSAWFAGNPHTDNADGPFGNRVAALQHARRVEAERRGKVVDPHRARCDNCGKTWTLGQLRDIKSYGLRVDAGGAEPAGECPDCGALAYEVKPKRYGGKGRAKRVWVTCGNCGREKAVRGYDSWNPPACDGCGKSMRAGDPPVEVAARRPRGGKGRAKRGHGGPFYQGEPGYCPECGAPSTVVARGWGGWDEDRECERGHRFSVTFNHSNDPGTVVAGGHGGKARGAAKKRCLACGGPTRSWAGLDWCPRCFAAVVTAPRGGKARLQVAGKKGPRGGRTEIQSLLFPRPQWTVARAKAWAKRNDFRRGDVDVTEGYVRLRQRDPADFRQHRVIPLGKPHRRTGQLKAVLGIR